MTILDNIVAEQKQLISALKMEKSISELEKKSAFSRKAFSLYQQLADEHNMGIIAEFKRQSPSKGDINKLANVEKVAKGYQQAGAAAISVLTNQRFFGALPSDFALARQVVSIPLLRKEFIVDEYQIVETKAMGADILLLIAACLSKKEIKSFASIANNIGLQVLLEIHTEEELEKINDHCDFVGINNRNLKTFEVDVENSIRLANSLPKEKIKIAESGLSEIGMIKRLSAEGFRSFLMGENFMKTKDPGASCQSFIQELKK